MATYTNYDAKDCTILVDNFNVTGLGSDMVTGSKDQEFFTTSVGAQGDVITNETNDNLGTIDLVVQATSPQKDTLLQYARAGTVFPIWITNKSIGERMGGTMARIKNYPELANSAEASDRTFSIQVFDYVVEPC